jgi:CBS domain containing-hemolysin-like protein
MIPAFLVFLLICSAIFSASETAFLSLGKERMPSAIPARISKMVAQPLHFLSLILMGNTLANVTFSSLATAYVLAQWGEPVLGWATVVMTALVLLFGEILPKTIAVSIPEGTALFLVLPLRVLIFLLSPITQLFRWAGERSVNCLVGRSTEKLPPLNRAEMEAIAEQGAQDGLVTTLELHYLKGILSLGEKTAGEILVPRPQMIALPSKASPMEAVSLLKQQGLSRLPVYEGTLDQVVGILYAKDLVAHREAADIKALLRPVFAVPEGIQLAHLLAEFRSHQSHIALVLDEYGGTAGLVTLEDLLEEIVGEIWDEHDTIRFTWKRFEDGALLLHAGIGREDLRPLGLELPEESDNLATYIVQTLGHVPQKGERIGLGEWQLVVLKATPQRVELVRAQH